jgi:hypothetical protein
MEVSIHSITFLNGMSIGVAVMNQLYDFEVQAGEVDLYRVRITHLLVGSCLVSQEGLGSIFAQFLRAQ